MKKCGFIVGFGYVCWKKYVLARRFFIFCCLSTEDAFKLSKICQINLYYW